MRNKKMKYKFTSNGLSYFKSFFSQKECKKLLKAIYKKKKL